VDHADDAEARALARLDELRAARAATVAAVADGATTPARLLRSPDPVTAGLRVLTLLEAAPGASKVGSRRLLDEVGIDELATVEEAGPDPVARLADALDASAAAS